MSPHFTRPHLNILTFHLAPPFLLQLFSSFLPVTVYLLKRAEDRGFSLSPRWSPLKLKVGVRHFFTRCVGGGCFVSSPAVSCLCLCCLIPAAERHQAKLFQLTLGCRNNGLLYVLSSTDTFKLQAERKRSPKLSCFINTGKSLNSPSQVSVSSFTNLYFLMNNGRKPHISFSFCILNFKTRKEKEPVSFVCSASAGGVIRQLCSNVLQTGNKNWRVFKTKP